jgi:hypothetical protein
MIISTSLIEAEKAKRKRKVARTPVKDSMISGSKRGAEWLH